jgi:hypothetical protein
MRGLDGAVCSNISATPAAFNLKGGVYLLDVIATWNSTGTVTLARLGPDGSTYLTAATAISANGNSGAIALPPGTYQLIIATATAVYASLTRIPGE